MSQREVPGIKFVQELSPDIRYNHAYMPVEMDQKEFGMSSGELCEKLREYNLYSRRYFYPLICDYACSRSVSIKEPLTVACKVADRILTLPIYDTLQLSDVEAICEMIRLLLVQKGVRVKHPTKEIADSITEI